MNRQLPSKPRVVAVVAVMVVTIFWVAPSLAFGQTHKDSQDVQHAYEAYVQAWKTKDIPALQKLISDDYGR
jgi:predicted lipid-binding transport protein (Tim44 family)